MLIVLIANLVIGGILLPHKTAQAIPVTDIKKIAQDAAKYVKEAAQWVWQKAQAAYHAAASWISAGVDLWDKQNSIVKEILDIAWDRLRNMLLNMLVNDIVKWIQGGGKPRFVTDWKGFLETAADKAAGNFISQNLGAGFLCGPFAVKLQIALAKPPTFDESATCTLSDITNNIDDFFSDFSNGGWKGWITVAEPQNNIFGADLLALDERYDLIAKAQEASKNEAGSAAGFLGDKVCVAMFNATTKDSQTMESYNGYKESDIPEGYQCTKWSTRTPGRVVGDSLQQAVGKDMQMLISAEEFSEYAGAIIDAVINRTIKEGILALKGTGSANASGPGITTAAYVSANATAVVNAAKSGATVPTIIQQENLLKDNMNSVLKEYLTNLNILNQVKTVQENTVQTLQQIVSLDCTLPNGASINSQTSSTQGNCATTCPCETTTITTTPFSISGLGSGALQQTTIKKYDLISGAGCTSITYSSTNSAIINSSLTYQTALNQTQQDIASLQSQLTKIDPAITDMAAYQTATEAYQTAYDAANNNSGAQTTAISTQAVASAQAIMDAAKNKALISTKALTGNSSNDLSAQLDAIMQLSSATAQKVSEAQTKRGYSSDCEFTDAGSYQGALCAAQTQQASAQTSYNTCLASQYNWNW